MSFLTCEWHLDRWLWCSNISRVREPAKTVRCNSAHFSEILLRQEQPFWIISKLLLTSPNQISRKTAVRARTSKVISLFLKFESIVLAPKRYFQIWQKIDVRRRTRTRSRICGRYQGEKIQRKPDKDPSYVRLNLLIPISALEICGSTRHRYCVTRTKFWEEH